MPMMADAVKMASESHFSRKILDHDQYSFAFARQATNMRLPANSSALHLGSQADLTDGRAGGTSVRQGCCRHYFPKWHGRQFSLYLVRKFSMLQVKGQTTTNKGATF
jgi:hypothetical protein